MSASTNATNNNQPTLEKPLTDAERRKKHLRDARNREAENDKAADFSSLILRERLQFSVPLQKLYEMVVYERFDLKKACKPFDNYDDETVTQVNFERVLLTEVASLSTEEATELSSCAPRLNTTYEHLKDDRRRHSSRDRSSFGRNQAARRELD